MSLAEGRTRLHDLCAEGKYDEAEALLEADENDLDARDSGGSAAIHYAVLCNHPRIAKLLCDWGARPDPPNALGDTPLDLAVRHNRLECLEILLADGVRLYDTRQPSLITDEMRVLQRIVDDEKSAAMISDDSDDFNPFFTRSYDTIVEERMQKQLEQHISAEEGSSLTQ